MNSGNSTIVLFVPRCNPLDDLFREEFQTLPTDFQIAWKLDCIDNCQFSVF